MGKKADPELAAAKQKIAASSPGMDTLVEKDPGLLTVEEVRDGVEHLRNERALWQLKQQRAGKNRSTEGIEGVDKDEDEEESE